MPKRYGVMTPEQCAERLTNFLARKPKSPKTRHYLATLPKRPEVFVSPMEFKREERVRGKEIALKVVAACEVGVNIPPAMRMDRMRPSARQPSPWNCRTHNRYQMGVGVPREPRVKDVCDEHRIALYEAQNGLCGLCGCPMPKEAKNSLDHVVPRFLGGKDALGNLVLSHGECNGRKSNDEPTGCEAIWLVAVNARLGV